VKIADLNRFLVPLRNRIVNMVARAVVQVVDDSAKMQLLQLGILDGETRDGLERLQEYGFTSVPEDGAEAVVLFPGGSRDHGLVIAVDDRRYRLNGLGAGEVAVYHKGGGRIHFKADGSLEIKPGTGGDVKIIEAVNVTVEGSAKVTVNAPAVDVGSGSSIVTLAGGSLPIARVGDSIVGTAGPYPIAAVIAPPGNPQVLG
jgi:phage baseplate assembly protein V